MRPHRLTHFAILLWLAALAFASTAVRRAKADDTAVPTFSVPITLREGHIWLDGTINGHPAHFVLDTGAGDLLITPEAALRCGVKLEKPDIRFEGIPNLSVHRASGFSMGVGDAQLSNADGVVAAMPEAFAGCDGLLGGPFFKHFIVTLDYDKARCTIASGEATEVAPANIPLDRLSVAPTAISLPMDFDGKIPMIKGAIGDDPVWLRIDSGDSSGAMLYAPYVKAHDLHDRILPHLQTVIGRGIGANLFGDIARLPSLTLGTGSASAPGTIALHQIVTRFSRDTRGAFYSTKCAGQIGDDLLRHFTVTFDYPHRRVRFAPNASFGIPFEYNRTGMVLDRLDGRWVVVDVQAGGPAAAAGIAVGDEIVSLDGISASDLATANLYDKIRQPVGTQLRVVWRSKSHDPAPLTLTLRDMI